MYTIGNKLAELEAQLEYECSKDNCLVELKQYIGDNLIDDEYYYPSEKGISFHELFYVKRYPQLNLKQYEKELMPYIADIINRRKPIQTSSVLLNGGFDALLKEGYDSFLTTLYSVDFILIITKYIFYSQYNTELELTKALDDHIMKRLLRFIQGDICTKEGKEGYKNV